MSKKHLDELGVSAFCESMAMMIQSGIQTDEAISLLQSESQNGGVLEQGLREMKTLVDQGCSLAKAMKSTDIFPEYAVRMVDAGESSGRLENILFRLARYYADQKTLSEKLRGAVTYPAAMLVLIIAVLSVMLTIVLPAFRAVYDRLTGSLASSAYAYIRWAGVFCAAALAVMALLVIALLAGLLLWKSGRRGMVLSVLEKLPRCRSIIKTNALFRFTSALGTYLASGEMQDEAVLKSIPMTGDEGLEEKLCSLAGHMEEGHSFAQAAWDKELLEPVYGRMLLAGERSGSLEQVLGRLTGLLEEDVGHQTDRLVEIVSPALSGFLMVTIGLTLISVMLPLIGMMNAIG
ncbi:MAG: type II secretion system F family protein [Oscillospiraceae bacterium]|nr:type II secretion system F family protein [Oscillospiraceae bacterium]